MKILLVDDSSFLRIANAKSLTAAGYEVIAVADGEQALKRAATGGFDLIVLDMMLPRLSGTEVLAELKKDPVTAAVPVLVLTSLAQKNEANLKKHGAAAYFEKSSLMLDKGSDQLVQAVRSVMKSQ